MKSRIIKTSIGSLVFVLLIFSALILLRPVYTRISAEIASLTSKMRSTLEENTGITFSYSSLSPSILSRISVKGIVVSDSVTGEKIFTIRKLVLSYSIFRALKQGVIRSISRLSLNDVVVEYDAIADKNIRDKINLLINTIPKKETAYSSAFALNKITGFFPFDVHAKNVTINYRNGGIDASLRLYRATLRKNVDYGIGANINGYIVIKTEGTKQLSCEFTSRGNLSNDLKGSSASFYMSDISTKHLHTKRFNFLVNYDGNNVKIKTLNNVFPLYAEVYSSVKSKKIDFSIKTDNLFPLRVIQLTDTNDLIKKNTDTSISVLLNGSYDFENKKFDYKSSGSIDISPAFIPKGASISYSMDGTNSIATFHNLSFAGEDYDIRYEGDCDIKKLCPTGYAEIQKIALKNGNIISADVYFDSLDSEVECFMPQLYIGERSLTAVQVSVIPSNESIDFTLEGYDYSHEDEPGKIRVDGSYILNTKYVQAGVSVNNFFLDSMMHIAAAISNEKTSASLQRVAASSENYVFSGELYFSSDLKTISYNVPYAIVANTKKDLEFAVFSLDGNNASLQLSRFNLMFGGVSLTMTGIADFLPDMGGVFFSTDITCNDIPYRFTGTMSNSWLDVNGDYGFHATASYTPSPINMLSPYLSGSVHIDAIPFAIKKYVFTVGADASFLSSDANGFSCAISRFELEEASGLLVSSPKFELMGNLNRYGLVVDSFAYTDAVSVMDGGGSLLWNVHDGVFDSANVDFSASSALTDEKWHVDGDVTNPSERPFSLAALKEDFYFSWQASLSEFACGRLLSGQSDEDAINIEVSLNGTLENPYLSFSAGSSSISVLGSPLTFSGLGVFEDGVFRLMETNARWLMLEVSDMEAEYTANTMSGSATTNVNAVFFNQTLDIPLSISFDVISQQESAASLDSYVFRISSANISGSLFAAPVSLGLTLLRTPGRFDIYSEGDMDVEGYALDGGEIKARVGKGSPVQVTLAGYLHNDGIYLHFSDLEAELEDFSSFASLPFFSVYKGRVTGDFSITGIASDPEFGGVIAIEKPDFNLPIIIPEHFTSDKMRLQLEGSSARMPATLFHVANTYVLADVEVEFDRWNFVSLSIGVHADKGVYVPADVDLGNIKIQGLGNPDMKISVMKDHAEVTGRILAKNTSVHISTKVIQQAVVMATENGESVEFSTTTRRAYGLYVALDIQMGQKVQLLLDPLVRGIAQPGTELSIQFDSIENKLALDGDITFRGGEIFYFNRNFYMKEGRIVFNDNQDTLDPLITVKAETRERDDDGSQITVILSAVNEPASRFKPVFSTVPARSESEIMELLGQVMSGNSEDVYGVLMSGGDFVLQTTVMRKIEGTLRDLFNFDIFSIRTMVLQNAMKQSLNMNSDKNDNTVGAGNFLDNSTVYMGKYFSRELYVDAMLHWTYDKTRTNDNGSTGGLVFQPEIGMELDSPFGKIRWGTAFNMDSVKNNIWMPATAVTLSWKFSF